MLPCLPGAGAGGLRLRDYLQAFLLAQRGGVAALGKPVVAACVLEVRAVAAVDYADVGRCEFLDGLLAVRRFGLDYLPAVLEADLHGVAAAGQGVVLPSVFYVWPEAAFGHDDIGAVELPDCAGELEQFQGVFEAQVLDELAFRQAGIMLLLAFALLHIGAVLPNFAYIGWPSEGSFPRNFSTWL